MLAHLVFWQPEILGEHGHNRVRLICNKGEISADFELDLIKSITGASFNPIEFFGGFSRRGHLNAIGADHALAIVKVKTHDICGFPGQREYAFRSAADHDGRMGRLDRFG